MFDNDYGCKSLTISKIGLKDYTATIILTWHGINRYDYFIYWG